MQLSLKNLCVLTLAGLLATSFAVSAQDGAHDGVIKERQDVMKTMGGSIRGADTLTGQAAIDLGNLLVADFGRLVSLFPEGSTGPDSEASPAIWEDAAGFDAVVEKGKAQAAIILAAAQAGDQPAFAAGIQGLGPVCGECHRSFRVRK